MIRSTNDDRSHAVHGDPLDLDASFSARFERSLRNAVLVTIVITVLAFGAVEYWSIALFGFLTIGLFTLWGIRTAFASHPRVFLPLPLLPLLLAITYAIIQAISSVDADQRHWAISMDPEATWLVTEVMCTLLLASLLVANLFHSRYRLLLLRNFLIVFGLIYSIFAIINHFTWNGRYFWLIEPTMTSSHPFGSFVNHNHFAGLVEMLAPLPLALVLTRTVRNELALINGFSAAILSVATVLSLSRGGMISLLSGLLFTVVLSLRPSESVYGNSNRTRLIATRVLISFAIFAVLAVGVLWMGGDAVIQRLDTPASTATPNLANVKQSTESSSAFYQSRGFIWEDTIRIIRSNWLVGVGLGAFQTTYPIYSRQNRHYLVGQSHNDYLQLVADGGLPLASIAILFLVLLVRAGIKAIKHPDPTLASLAIGCCGGIFAFLVHAIFDFNFQITSNCLVFLTLTVIVWRIAFFTANKRVGKRLIQQSLISGNGTLQQTEMEVWS